MQKKLVGQSFVLIINIVGLLFFMYALVSTYEKMKDNEISSFAVTGWLILSMLIISLIAFTAAKFLSKKLYIILLISTAFLLRIGWAYWIKTPIISDFHVLYTGGIDIANGDYQFAEGFYFQKWTYQLGFSFYEAMVISIFGESPRMLKLLNILYSVGTVFVVYITAAKAFNELSGRIAGLIYAFYLPSIVMCSVLTNQHLSTFLYFLALYFVVHNGFVKKYSWIFIGLLIGIGNIIRPLGSIVLLAIAVYMIIFFLLKGNKQIYIMYLKKFVGIAAVYFLVQQIVSYTIIGMGITDETLKNKDSLYKFVVGFNYETTGRYSAEDRAYLDQFALWEERNEKAKELIEERLSDKEQVLELMKEKFIYMWGDQDAAVYWSLTGLEPAEQFVDNLYKIERVMYVYILTFCFIACLYILLWRPQLTIDYLLPLIFLLGYAAAHLLIEVQTRYRFDIMPAFMILQGYGVYVVVKRFKKLMGFEKEVKQF